MSNYNLWCFFNCFLHMILNLLCECIAKKPHIICTVIAIQNYCSYRDVFAADANKIKLRNQERIPRKYMSYKHKLHSIYFINLLIDVHVHLQQISILRVIVINIELYKMALWICFTCFNAT